jgi:hypothetical protein
VIDEDMTRFEGKMPANFSGSWERNYARGDSVYGALSDAYYRLSRKVQRDPVVRGAPVPTGPSAKDVNALEALANLVELITRPDELTISQNEYEIRVDRKDDFSMLCSFYDGIEKGIESPYGVETCGWNGKQLVSHLKLPDGLEVTHRFDISTDYRQLRVETTVSSNTSKVPITLRRFYTKFRRPTPRFECIETLSMKRVCSTGELKL